MSKPKVNLFQFLLAIPLIPDCLLHPKTTLAKNSHADIVASASPGHPSLSAYQKSVYVYVIFDTRSRINGKPTPTQQGNARLTLQTVHACNLCKGLNQSIFVY